MSLDIAPDEHQDQCKGAAAASHAGIIAEQSRLAESPVLEWYVQRSADTLDGPKRGPALANRFYGLLPAFGLAPGIGGNVSVDHRGATRA